MKQNITAAVLAAAITFLVWVLLSDGCGKPTDSHTDDKEQLKAERDSLIKREAAVNKQVDSLTISLRQADTVIHDLMAETRQTRTELDKSKSLSQRLAGELKGKQDTTEYGRKIDSLVNEVVNLTFLLEQYQRYTDSLTSLNEEQKDRYESILSQRAQLYSQLRTSYDHTYAQYNKLFIDYTDRGKTIKRERLKSKIAALLALIATGLLIVK